jgi:hypothetical protein
MSRVNLGVLYTMEMGSSPIAEVYTRRQASDLRSRLYRALKPPEPFIRNPDEPLHFPLGRWNLYVGGGGSRLEGYVKLDLFVLPGVNVIADVEHLPFGSGVFQCTECDAVLECAASRSGDPRADSRATTPRISPSSHTLSATRFISTQEITAALLWTGSMNSWAANWKWLPKAGGRDRLRRFWCSFWSTSAPGKSDPLALTKSDPH